MPLVDGSNCSAWEYVLDLRNFKNMDPGALVCEGLSNAPPCGVEYSTLRVPFVEKKNSRRIAITDPLWSQKNIKTGAFSYHEFTINIITHDPIHTPWSNGNDP